MQPDFNMVLVCETVTLGPSGELPTVTVPGPESDIVIKVTGVQPLTYVMPGHTNPGSFHLLTLKVDVAKPRDPGPGFLNVVSKG